MKTIFQKTIAWLMVLTMSLGCMAFSASASDDGAVMTVVVEGGETRNFTTFNDGWVYALEQSLNYPVTLTLLADWVAPDGKFYCEDADGDEYGTDNGRLYLYYNYLDLTIDLNGHKIDRNLSEARDDGQVFSIQDRDIKLTIKDSVGGGKITGGNNTGNGGGLFVYNGSVFIEGGEITGNKANNGAGIYWESRDNLCVYGGKITGNTATKNGGGIYSEDYGMRYFGGDAYVSGNTGNGATNNLYLEDEDVVIRRTAGQNDGAIPNVKFKNGACIGVSAADKNNVRISGTESYFNWLDYTHFFSDDSAYGIRPAHNDSRYDWTSDYDSTHQKMMYLTPVEDIVYPKLTAISLRSNVTDYICEYSLDQEKQLITVTAYYEDMKTLKKYHDMFISTFAYAADTEGVDTYSIDYLDWSVREDPVTHALVSEQVDGTYNTFDIAMNWICRECTDNTGDAKCDDCGKDVNLVAIGDVGYPTLQDAINNAQKGDTIKLLVTNILLAPVTVPEDKEVTIDFAGNRLWGNENVTGYSTYIIQNYGNLTITDTVGDPDWRNMEYEGIKTYGPLTINEGDFRVVQGLSNVVYAINAPVTINAGIFACAGYGASIHAEGSSTVTINGGWFQNDMGGCTMEAVGNPKFYINGGTFRGNMSKSGAVDCVITGGIFDASEAYFAEEYVADGCVVAPNTDKSHYAVVELSDYFTYLGSGLKYAGASADSAKIRFGYDFADDFDLEASNWHWNIGLYKDGLYTTAEGVNFDEDNVTNLVVSGIEPTRYESNIYAQLVFDVVIDGETFTVEDKIRGTYINYLADSIIANPNENAAVKEYAKQLKAAYNQNKAQ